MFVIGLPYAICQTGCVKLPLHFTVFYQYYMGGTNLRTKANKGPQTRVVNYRNNALILTTSPNERDSWSTATLGHA